MSRWVVHGAKTNIACDILEHRVQSRNTHIAFPEHFPTETIQAPTPTLDVWVALALGATTSTVGSVSSGEGSAHIGDWVSPWQAVGPWRNGQ